MGTTLKLRESDVNELTSDVRNALTEVKTDKGDVPSVKQSSGIMISQYYDAIIQLADTMKDFVELVKKDMNDIDKAAATITALDRQLDRNIKS